MKGKWGIVLLVFLLTVVVVGLGSGEAVEARTGLKLSSDKSNPTSRAQEVPDDFARAHLVDAENIELIGQIGGQTQAVVVDGSYAYSDSAAGAGGLRIIDVANPAQPTEVGFYDTPGSAFDVAKAGNLVHVADGAAGLRIIDVSNPINPIETGYYNLEFPTDVAVAGSYSYIADLQDGLQIIDVTNLANPIGVGNYDIPGTDWG